MSTEPAATQPRQCFWIDPLQHGRDGWIPSLVTEGEPGHAPLTGRGAHASPWYWGRTYEEACATCNRQNARTFKLTPQEANWIVLSSMAAGREG